MLLVTEHFDLDETVPEPNVERASARSRRWVLPAGMPFLVDVETGEVVSPVLRYCRYKFAAPGSYQEGLWKKLNSAEAAVSDLKDWWYKLHARGIPWDVADDDLVAEWLIDLRTSVSGQTGDFLASETVKRRAATVSEFYRWALDECLVDRAPTAVRSKRLAKGKLAQSRRPARKQEWTRYDADPHPIDASTMPEIEVRMGQRPSELADKWPPAVGDEPRDWNREPGREVRCSVHRLATELAISCGMRIDEILNLDLAPFEDFECEAKEAFKSFELRITHTKGLVPREVFIPFWLMTEIAEYIANERDVAMQEAARVWAKGAQAGSRTTKLLVNPPGSGRHVGKRLTSDTLEAKFHEACLAIGLVKKRAKAVGTNKAHAATVVRHTFHDLRHTFAVWTYHSLEDIGIQRPWIRIQKLLGHASVSTTVGTYLKVLESFGPDTLELLNRTYQHMRDRWRHEDKVTVH